MIHDSRSRVIGAVGLVLFLTLGASRGAAQHGAMHQTPAADSVLAAARRAAAPIVDTTAARAAGFIPIEEMGIPDRNPFQGQHWYNKAYSDTLADVPLGTPAFVMFAPINGTLQRIAVAYATRLRLETAPPPGLGDDGSAIWHVHVLCNLTAPNGRTIVDQVPDTAACRASGGVPFPRKTAMIHVWTDVSNPEGMYGHDNPALPFLVVGLHAPDMAELHDVEKGRAGRELALALGETYGARLENAYLIEQSNRNTGLADSLKLHRAAIAALVARLRQAEGAGDRSAYSRIATRLRAEGAAVEAIYERMATPEARALLRRQRERALSSSMMM